MNKTLRVLAALIFTSIGGGLIYGSAANSISVGADAIYGQRDDSLASVAILVVGVLLIASGIMSALFLFASLPGRKK